MVAVAILAAGRGTRMKSNLPKVLHLLEGRSLIERVLQGCLPISPTRCLIIVGYQADQVKTTLKELDIRADLPLDFVEQAEQRGTGHAVQQLLSPLQGFTGDLLVLNGDVPLLRPQTIKQLVQTHQQHQNSATVLTAHMPNPEGYGRVFCDGQNMIKQILEDRDCTAVQKQNRRINAGIYCFRWPDLAQVLPDLQPNNNQHEYYLTETLSQMASAMAVDVDDYQEVLGINDQQQLATAYEILQRRRAKGE